MVGVNAYQVEEDKSGRPALPVPDPTNMRAHIAAFRGVQASGARRQRCERRMDRPRAPPQTIRGNNIFERVVDAAEAGCTHGEICATLRRELGFGQPLVWSESVDMAVYA